MKLSIVIPAHNEEANVGRCIEELRPVLRENEIPYEIIVVDDNSDDGTADAVRAEMEIDPDVRLVNRTPPPGFGRAVRAGLAAVRGDVVVIYMADCSDDPADAVLYYRKILEGYDCVYGSRFIRGSHVEKYPRVKLIVNRIVNNCIRLMFWTRFNDLTNAFKAYRTAVIRDCGPYRASHFNITLEMSLGALVRGYQIAEVPIRWYGRTWGTSHHKLRQMGRKYLCTLLMVYFQRRLIADDLIAERLAANQEYQDGLADPEGRVRRSKEVLKRSDEDSPRLLDGAAAASTVRRRTAPEEARHRVRRRDVHQHIGSVADARHTVPRQPRHGEEHFLGFTAK